MRGVPFNCSEIDIKRFYKDITDVKDDDIVFKYLLNGRLAGEVIVRFIYEFDWKRAMILDKSYIGRRYIELFESNFYEFNEAKDSKNDYYSQYSKGQNFNG